MSVPVVREKGLRLLYERTTVNKSILRIFEAIPNSKSGFLYQKNRKLWKLWKQRTKLISASLQWWISGQRIMEGSYGLKKIIVIKNTRNNVTSTRIREQWIKHIAEPSLFWDFQIFIYLFFRWSRVRFRNRSLHQLPGSDRRDRQVYTCVLTKHPTSMMVFFFFNLRVGHFSSSLSKVLTLTLNWTNRVVFVVSTKR